MEAKAAEQPAGMDTHSDLLSKVGSAGTIEIVEIDELHIDPAYQRDLSRDLVDKIKEGWDPAAAGPIVVSRRPNGDLFIVNGQHRTAAAKELGMKGMLAQVVNGLTAREEAELRLMGNTRRTDTAQERFRAQVAAGHPESLAIVDIVKNFDTRINPSPDQKHGINAVSSVEKIYRVDGQGLLLTRVLEVLKDAFGTISGKAAGTSMMQATAWILERHRDELDKRRLVEQLAAEGTDSIDRKARNYKAASGGSMWLNYYRAFVEVYNHRLGEAARLEIRAGGWSKARVGEGGGYNS